jgi:hypothetical protein
MKKTTIIFLLITILANVKGQNYTPFPTDSTIWSVSNYKFSINGDTLINSKLYQKFYIQSDTTYFSFDIQSANYFASIREENKQLFFIPKDSTNEYLLYDFSKNIGDTVRHYSMDFLQSVDSDLSIIQSTDSIQIDNQYRKRFKIKKTSTLPLPEEYWIEGIGSTIGLFFPGYNNHNMVDIPIHELLCVERKNIIIYQTILRCFHLPSSDVKEIGKTFGIRLSIKPNPFTYESLISINGNIEKNETYSLSLFDLTGKLVKNINFNENITLYRDNLECGVYYLVLKSSKYSISKKIVIL